ncbi:MAG: right-handed parallel beta-helix repeat-containing protein [Mycobacteriales bacterium]
MRLRKATALTLLLTSAACTNPGIPESRTVPERLLYVSPSGSDRNPGTLSRPFRQVSVAARVATPGTVVHVAPGDYAAVTSARSGTKGAPITFRSDDRWEAKVRGPGSTSAWTNTGDWVVVQGFDISGSSYSGITTTASHGRFVDNHVHDLVAPNCLRGGGGIVAESYTATDNDTVGNVIHDIGTPGQECGLIHGIYYQSPAAGRIERNVIHDVSGAGIHLWHNANTVTITGNLVFHNRQDGIAIGGSREGNDLPPGVASHVTVTDNVVRDNGHYGIRELGRVGLNSYVRNVASGNAYGDYHLIGGAVPVLQRPR